MKYHLVLLCFAITFSLFFIKTAYSVNVSAKYDDSNLKAVFIVKNAFELRCEASEDATAIKWEKYGKEVNSSDKRFVFKKPSPTEFTISTNQAQENDAGNYSCIVYTKDQKQTSNATILVAHQVHVKVPTNINVVEGEKLKIECLTIGRPTVRWTYQPEEEPKENTRPLEESERVSFKADDNNVNGTILEIIEITEKDRGFYTCIGKPTSGAKEEKASCTVRVKSRYAALWPFLGICVEVIVLCLIIFIYEKKRNKTELEESDTDQSPDQKNTPDHGKDANLRHRQ